MHGTARDPEAHVVVAAVIVRGDAVLLCHRHPARRWYPDVWDLPGGHVEAGETPLGALRRELSEELAIEWPYVRGQPLRLVDHVAGFDLRIWVVDGWTGSIVNLRPDEHDEIRWFSSSDLSGLELAEERYRAVLTGLLDDARRTHCHAPPSDTASAPWTLPMSPCLSRETSL